MKRYLRIIEKLADDGDEKLKDYKLEIRQIHRNRVGIVEVKLFYKDKVVLKFKEGFNRNKTYGCSKAEHKTLVNIKQNIFFNEEEIKW